MSNLNYDIGKRLAHLRKENHLTQEQFAEKLDISVKHCSSVERGMSSLSLEKMICACEILDTNLDYLVRGRTSDDIQYVPDKCIDLFKHADAEETKILKEYIEIYSKIKTQS